MMSKKFFGAAIVALLTLCVASPWMQSDAHAQSRNDKFSDAPGYFDFGDIDKFTDGDEMVEIDLAQPLLGLFAGLMDGEDPEIGDLLRSVDLVNVRVFSYERDVADKLREHVGSISGRLEKDGWDSIVRVRGEDEHVNVYVKMHGAKRGEAADEDTTLEGIAILALEDDEAVFVNVVGSFGMDEISLLGRHFDIPHMEDWDDDRRDRRSKRSDG
jgi:hypothetical protein